MKRNHLANIQWQMMRSFISVSLLMSIFIIFYLTYREQEGFLELIQKKMFGMPIVLLIPFTAIMVGGVFGYLIGNGLKKRHEHLQQGAMAFERGNFAYRIDEIREDEIGLMARQMNAMAIRVEKQVASLQRLSGERAEWRETIKQAAITEERQRLARDLHDAVSQQLFAIVMMTAAAKQTVTKDLQKGQQQLGMIETMAGTAQSEMRALLLHLRPAHLDGKALDKGIENLLIELKSKHGLNIHWKIESFPEIPKGIEDHIFRIVQEALSNILRHSKATRIELQLRLVDKQIRLKVIDNGVGFEMSEQKASSYGLQTMRERVNEIGGVFEIISLPGKGTQISAAVPIIHVDEGVHEDD